jgi:hypothetical protein
MQFRRFAFILASLILMMGIGQSIRNVQAQDAKPAESLLYVGQLTDNPDVFVGMAISEGKATIYICDGQADKAMVTFGEWFSGPVKDNAIDITAPSGNSVQITITDPVADGQFLFKDGTVKKVSLKLDLDAQLLRSEFTLDNTQYVAGWIILADGSVRGSMRKQTTKPTTATNGLTPVPIVVLDTTKAK